MKPAVTSLTFRLGKTAVVLALLWLFGFAGFALTLPVAKQVSTLHPADGIVVLTGGEGRLNAGFDLLTKKKGTRLLVSGVHRSVAEKDLLDLTDAPDHLFNCCVDLDKASANTVDNAAKSAEWAHTHQFKSLYLVTSDYHMHRSVVLLKAALPDCEILPFPVETSISLQGMAIEYTKFVVTYFRTALTV